MTTLPRTRLVVAALLLAVGLWAPPSLSAITAVRITCATTATLAYTAATGGSTALFRNAGTASVFLGAAAVTTSTGFEVIPGAAVSLPLGPSDPVYCIVVTSTNRLDVVESRR